MATTQKQVKTRIQQKHDTSANWGKATSFVPLKGEIVVYDDLGRIKVGDGTKTVANLKFVDEHPHPYLPLTGGTIAGNLTVSGSDGKSGKITTRQLSIEYAEINVAGTSGTGIFIAANDAETMLTIRTDGLQFYANKNKVIPTWTFTGISDTKGVSSTLAASLKCLNDNYLPLTGGTLTGDLNFSSTDYDMTVSADGVDVAYTDGAGRTQLLPNSITCMNSAGATTIFNADGLNFGQTQSIITGISDSKGTSSTIAASLKCLSDNYVAKTDISNKIGTDTTKVPSLKCLTDNYVAKNGEAGDLSCGSLTTTGALDVNGDAFFYGSIGGDGGFSFEASTGGAAIWNEGQNIRIGNATTSYLDYAPDGTLTNTKGTNTLKINSNSIECNSANGSWSLTGISDAKGASSTVAASLKCLNDNYIAKTGGTISGTYSETGKAGSTYLGPGFVEVFSEGTGQITVYNKDSNGMTVDKSDLTPSGLGINGDGGSIVASFSKNGFWVNYGGGTNHVSVTAQNIAIGKADQSSDLTITADGIDFPELASHLTGITYEKGTSSTLAMSQKGVADNYLPLSGGTVSGNLIVGTSTAKKDTTINGNLFVNGCKITGTSSGVGTSATEMPTLKCLHDNYLALSGGTLTGQLTLSNNGIKFNTNAIKDITYSTIDLTAGTSTLATNSIYIVYE